MTDHLSQYGICLPISKLIRLHLSLGITCHGYSHYVSQGGPCECPNATLQELLCAAVATSNYDPMVLQEVVAAAKTNAVLSLSTALDIDRFKAGRSQELCTENVRSSTKLGHVW